MLNLYGTMFQHVTNKNIFICEHTPKRIHNSVIIITNFKGKKETLSSISNSEHCKTSSYKSDRVGKTS